MSKIKIKTIEHKKVMELVLLNQSLFGQNFNNGDRYFYASDSTLLSANQPRFEVHVRTGQLSFFMNEEDFKLSSIFFDKNVPKEMYLLDSIINAIKEYNEIKDG